MARASATPRVPANPGPAVILFGLGDDRRPRAAHFPAAHADLAVKAASAMGLNVLRVADPEQTKIAVKLPPGRIYANGRGLVPFVRKDLYAKVTEAARPAANGKHASAAPRKAAAAGSGSSAAGAQSGGSAAGQPPSAPASPPASSRRPTGFDDIKPGDLVLAHESLKEGWWEAIVVEVSGDMIKIRWRDYTRWPPEDFHRFKIALTCPDAT
jgi:hypothetical protein